MILVLGGNNSWGKAADVKEARRLCKRNGGKGPFTVYEVSDDYWIDEYGTGHGRSEAQLIRGKDRRDGVKSPKISENQMAVILSGSSILYAIYLLRALEIL